MSYTDLRFVGNTPGSQPNRSTMKKTRSLSLTNISTLKRNSYDHVESKVKRYIQQMKENNGQKNYSYPSNNAAEIKQDKMTLNIDANMIKDFRNLSEESSSMKEQVKLLISSPKNLEDKVAYISENPEAIYCLLCLLFEERKLRYEQDLTMKTIQLNYDNLLAKYANAKNSIDSFRLSQEVLTDLRSNSSFFSGPNLSSDEIKKAFSTPDLSIIDLSSASDMLIKTSYVPIVDPNLSIKLCMENTLRSKLSCDTSLVKSETNSAKNLKTIWIQIFQNLREKLKKCVLLEKNLALEGEDKKAAWNSIHNDFKCLYDMSNYQEDIRTCFGGELEDVKFAIHKYSMEYLGTSLITSDYFNPEEFASCNRKPSIFTQNSHRATSQPISRPGAHQIRPERVQILDKSLICASSRENDSGCLTSDCSPHPSMNDSNQSKPYYTISNNCNTECKNSDSNFDNQFRLNDRLVNESNEIFYNECTTSSNSIKHYFPISAGSSITSHSGESLTDQKIRNKNVAGHKAASSPDTNEKRKKYSAIFVTKSSTPDSTPPSSRQSSIYDLTRLESNSEILKHQLIGKGIFKEEKCRSRQRKNVENPHSKYVPTSINNQQLVQIPQKPHRSVRKHRSMQNVHCINDGDLGTEIDEEGNKFFTSTPKKSTPSAKENYNSDISTSNMKRVRSRTKDGKSSVHHHRSKSLFSLGRELKEVLEITEALKNQSRELLTKYKMRSETRP